MRGIGDRTLDASDKRGLLLDAAERSFAELGYAGTSMSSIAAQADVTRPTVYAYFPSKDEVFHALALRVRDEVQAVQEAADVSTPAATARSTLTAYLDVFVRHRAMLVVIAARALSDPRATGLQDEIFGRVNRRHARFLQRLEHVGRATLPAPATVVAEAVTGIVLRFADAVAGEASRQAALADALVDLYVQMVGLD